MEPSGIMDWPAKEPCGRPLRLRRFRGGRLSGVIEATKAQNPAYCSPSSCRKPAIGRRIQSRYARQDACDRRTEVRA